MDECLRIDGSHGEGGGQILRTSLALSLLTGRPLVIENIRAGRERQGLQRQHLTAVRAAIEISGAQATGAELGSRTLTFQPGTIRGQEFHFNVGTAGSTTLVLQTVLPALLLAEQPTRLVIEGGTHNPWAPPFEFLQQAYVPLINRMGPHVELELLQAGFAPMGGGRIEVRVTPARRLAGWELLERGAITRQQACVLLANLPEHIAQRELGAIGRRLGWDEADCTWTRLRAAGPGNAIVATITSEHITEVFSSIGRQGIRAELVASELVREVRAYVKSGVPVGPHLADQLLLPLGLSAYFARDSAATDTRPTAAQPRSTAHGMAGGAFRTTPLTGHSTTHIELLRQFLGVEIVVTDEADGTCVVRVAPPVLGEACADL
ncbi:MAG: RNA 3'-terminal phosphate cyclase [Planctomycetes bacterium]|nr:RNA 3'-terminal phosphate cyclase [Planctomycetota bacterium]